MPGGQQQRKDQLHGEVQSWPPREHTRNAECNHTVVLVFYLITTTREEVKSFVNTLILSKSEARLIYITTSKHTGKKRMSLKRLNVSWQQ